MRRVLVVGSLVIAMLGGVVGDVPDLRAEAVLTGRVLDLDGDPSVIMMVGLQGAGKTTTMKDFALQQYRVRATPVFAFFDTDGGYIKRARLTGKANSKEEFMLLGRYVVEGAYEKEAFTRYKRAGR